MIPPIQKNFSLPQNSSLAAESKAIAAPPSRKPEEFEKYLTYFEKQNSTHTIPLEMQKQLLAHFEKMSESQKRSIEYSKKICAEGGCSLVPLESSEKILQHYQQCVEMLKTSIAETELVELLYHGLTYYQCRPYPPRLSISQLNDLIPKLEAFYADKAIQKKYTDSTLEKYRNKYLYEIISIPWEEFGKINDLEESELIVLARYLVMIGKAEGYYEKEHSYVINIFLKSNMPSIDESKKPSLITKKHLVKIDQKMQQIQFPEIPESFDENERKQIREAIQEYHYALTCRMIYGYQGGIKYSDKIEDFLHKQGYRHSWEK